MSTEPILTLGLRVLSLGLLGRLGRLGPGATRSWQICSGPAIATRKTRTTGQRQPRLVVALILVVLTWR